MPEYNFPFPSSRLNRDQKLTLELLVQDLQDRTHNGNLDYTVVTTGLKLLITGKDVADSMAQAVESTRGGEIQLWEKSQVEIAIFLKNYWGVDSVSFCSTVRPPYWFSPKYLDPDPYNAHSENDESEWLTAQEKRKRAKTLSKNYLGWTEALMCLVKWQEIPEGCTAYHLYFLDTLVKVDGVFCIVEIYVDNNSCKLCYQDLASKSNNDTRFACIGHGPVR